MRHVTIGQRLDSFRGIGPGFDALRLGLSITILCWHSVLTSYGHAAEIPIWENPFSAPLTAMLPLFFALSGFLVIGSSVRNPDLRRFIALRGLRIVPALTTEVFVSALVLGSTLTVLPLSAYLSDPGFFRYFGSLAGNIQYFLPGVFAHNPYPNFVNSSLWTIAPELLCYIYMSILLLLRLQGNRAIVTGVVVALCAVAALGDYIDGNFLQGGVVNPRLLVASFGIGNVLYLWRHEIPWSRGLFALAGIAGLLTVRVPGLVYLAILCLAYCIVFVGLVRIPPVPVLSRGDYSYGIYLYAFPIQQTIASAGPAMQHWWISIGLGLPVTIGVAMLSWHVVEKPALALRSRIPHGQPARTMSFPLRWMGLTAMMVYGGLLMERAAILRWRELGVNVVEMAVLCWLVAGCVAWVLRPQARPAAIT